MITARLSKEDWTKRCREHAELVGPYTEGFIRRRSRGISHPVHDFLFTYYKCSPQKLRQWVPSVKEELEIDSLAVMQEYSWFSDYWFKVDDGALKHNLCRLQESTRALAEFVEGLCGQILNRLPRFGCFGLHEWAMVYKIPREEVRHSKYRLRVTSEELEEVVEGLTLCCSHYDAFRFFTKSARPLNVFQPTLDSRMQMEQGGCVHANMDLYKWSTKLWPWIGSDFIAKTFQLAIESRELDMRASPYDLSAEGYVPILVETEEGRRQYQEEQQAVAARAAPLRRELRDFCRSLLAIYDERVL